MPAEDAESGTSVAPPHCLEFLDKADEHGLLPPWTRWWDPVDVAPLFPDDATRAAVQAEEPRLPLSNYTQTLPTPPAWTRVPAGYVAFGDVYAAETAQARARRWPVRVLPGRHLHHLVDPSAVADAVTEILDELLADR